jgi:hypothetical protein
MLAYIFRSQRPAIAILLGSAPNVPAVILNDIMSTDVYPFPSVAATAVPEFNVVTRFPASVDPAYATFVP